LFNASAINGFMMTIGQKIEKLRKAKGLSRRELAEKIVERFGGSSVIGLSQYIYQVEKGKRKPKLDTLTKISSILGVSPSYFLEEERVTQELQYLGELEGHIALPVLGKVGAGDMIIPIPEGETYLVPLAGRRKPKPDWFVLKVEGRSMEPYIHDGSILVVEPAHFGYAENGQIVILCEGGADWSNGCTVKKVKDLGDKWLIIPFNEEYEAYVKPKSEVKIKGIVRKVIWEP